MRRVCRLTLRLILAVGLPTGAAACFIFNRVTVDPVSRPADSLTVSTAVKAHLLDGSTVMFADGVTLDRDTLRGAGVRYDVALARTDGVERLPLDSVLAMETFRPGVDAAATIVVSAVATAGATLATGLLLVAIFGSCPTVYSDSAGTAVLEAESFSYSIAPLFENRDVDLLRAAPGPDGVVRLEVRNEALETHALNHLELLDVRRGAGEVVVPDARGTPLALADLAPAARAWAGTRDVTAELRASDGDVFRTDPRRLDQVRPGDRDDSIHLVVPLTSGVGDTVAVVFRLRNSLLNTVLLYDEMLGARGARSLDWLGRDLSRVGDAVELGQWYRTTMGLRVAVEQGDSAVFASRLPDVGPIAWKDVAVLVPVPPGSDTLNLMLSFVADNWRIDRVAVARRWRRPDVALVPLTAVRDGAGTEVTNALAALAAADDRYVETRPGQQIAIEFRPAPSSEPRTFLLAAQGYYTEWVRGSWMAAGRDTSRFVPGEAALLAALQRWRADQASLEARFYDSRVPVR